MKIKVEDLDDINWHFPPDTDQKTQTCIIVWLLSQLPDVLNHSYARYLEANTNRRAETFKRGEVQVENEIHYFLVRTTLEAKEIEKVDIFIGPKYVIDACIDAVPDTIWEDPDDRHSAN